MRENQEMYTAACCLPSEYKSCEESRVDYGLEMKHGFKFMVSNQQKQLLLFSKSLSFQHHTSVIKVKNNGR